MNSKRSYLESLNAGRSRRQHASLEELNRSLEGLEARFGRGAESLADDEPGAAEEDDITRRMQKLSSEASRRGPVSENAHGGSRQSQMPGKDPLADRSFHSLARDMERARAQESGVASISKIATELHTLREELRQRMAVDAKNEGPAGEKSLQSAGRRWDDFGRHFDAAEERMSNSGGEAIAGIVERLEQIHTAVSMLPESLSLNSLEEKVRTLAAAVEHFARQKGTPGAATFEALEERLDEISRAIAASTSAQPLGLDNEPFARIEARIASLSKQLEEFADDHPAGEIMHQFNALAARVEDIAGRAELPEKAIDGLSRQIASIARKLDEGAGAPDAEFIFQGLERRFAALSDAFEQRQDDAREQSATLFRDLENRLERYNQEALSTDATIVEALNKRFADLSEAIAERNEPDPQLMRGLEERLDDIASRLGQSEHQINAIDPELIRDSKAKSRA